MVTQHAATRPEMTRSEMTEPEMTLWGTPLSPEPLSPKPVCGKPATVMVVNPAFLLEIKDSNPDLWAAVRELRSLCQPPSVLAQQHEPAETLRRLTRLLDSVRDAVALHFSLEETYGFLTVPADHVARPDHRVETAKGQHTTLYLGITDLAEQAEELQYRGVCREALTRLIGGVRGWDADLTEHEKLEARLIDRSDGAS